MPSTEDIAKAMLEKMFEMRRPVDLTDVICILSILKAKVIEDAKGEHNIRMDQDEREILKTILAAHFLAGPNCDVLIA